MYDLSKQPIPISLDELIAELLEYNIILLGEEGHWQRNILEKEELIIGKLIEKTRVVCALEYDVRKVHFDDFYTDEIYGSYLRKLVQVCQAEGKGKIVSLEAGEEGLRGMRMAKRIMMCLDEYPDSKIVAIVGAKHIQVCGSEIPATLSQDLVQHRNFSFTRVLLKAGTTTKDNILVGFLQYGRIYYF
ncbi:MAG: hypothetical protein ACUVQP_07090 [Bacteroidales bacterium]